jgi:hypothetical protein
MNYDFMLVRPIIIAFWLDQMNDRMSMNFTNFMEGVQQPRVLLIFSTGFAPGMGSM